ncbi:MAG TPA: CBS domain-containing protein [Pyrinomonadaceae bacterium]|nr:CBS domain-containing protein [Pyrinomonadaceae bacterium]
MYALVIEAGNTNYFALREIARVGPPPATAFGTLKPVYNGVFVETTRGTMFAEGLRGMGDKNVTSKYDEHEMRAFTRAVLSDLRALEAMLKDGKVECGRRRIGAEQEMFLVNESMRPAPLATEVIQEAGDPRLTTEIGRFNLEANLTPLEFHGDCLSRMESELFEVTAVVKRAAAKFNADTLMVGILPTIQQSDLKLQNLTPDPRYFEINRVVSELHGGDRFIHIKGVDELQLTLQDTFIEFCNTSFQIHLQVGADEFSDLYNWAQAVSAPVLALAVNSPLLLTSHLWQETRIALFQHATDTRSTVHQLRQQTPRVNFGSDWIGDSIIDILHDDVVRFRVLLTQPVGEDPMVELAAGKVPELRSWRLHNGTVWRWNRACYGITEGKAGLRIEARYLPAGPTIVDEMANAAFFLGLMASLPEEFGDVKKLMRFEDAKDNFFNAARYGLKSQIVWLDGESYRARRLILEDLLPRARHGLRVSGIDNDDIERFLGIIEERVAQEKTGAQWMLDSLAHMDPKAKKNVRMRTLTAAMKANQETGDPLHKWKPAEIPKHSEWIDNYRTVEQFMTTDLLTVRPEDTVDLAANLMHWKRIRHVPVEDNEGRLVGIVSHRDLMALFAANSVGDHSETAVREVMKSEPIVIAPETPTLEALLLMRENNIGCLPIIKGEKLVGLITAYDFLTVSAKLLEEKLLDFEAENG